MKNIKLLAMVAVLGLGGLSFGQNNASLKEINSISEKKHAIDATPTKPEIQENEYVQLESDGFYHAYILWENIKHGSTTPGFETISLQYKLNLDSDTNVDFEYDNTYFSVLDTTFDEESSLYTTKITGIKSTTKPIDLTFGFSPDLKETLKVHVINAYYNIADTTIPKPLTIGGEKTKIELSIVEDSDISHISEDELELKIISNKNDKGQDVIKRSNEIFGNPFTYHFVAQNVGTAKLILKYTKKINNVQSTIRKTNITINILENRSYSIFYEFNINGELTQVDESKPIELEANVLKTYYLGNGTNDFNPNDFELHESTTRAAFKTIGINSVVLDGKPYLQIAFITVNAPQKANVSVSFIDSNEVRQLKFNILSSEYEIKIDKTKINSPYYLTEDVNFYNVRDLVSVTKNGEKFDTTVEFSRIERKLGYQTVYVLLRNIKKTDCFTIYFTLNPKERRDSVKVTVDDECWYYKEFLSRISKGLPAEYDTAKDGYKDLQYQYKFLSSSAKTRLLNDLSFNKLYRRYIKTNHFEQSFFEGISVKLDNTRYIVPTITLGVFLLLFGIILGFSIHSIYHPRDLKIKKKKGGNK